MDVFAGSAGRNPRDAGNQIADTGIGVKDEDKPHIFERFYQAQEEGTNVREAAASA